MSGQALVIPVKATLGAKQRLSTRVPGAQRRMLALAMAGDMLRLATSVVPRQRVVVVAGDEDAEQLAGRHGVACIRERGAGQSAAVAAGVVWAGEQGFTAVATVAADCPLAQWDDLAALMEDAGRRDRHLACAPDAAGGGTNAAVVRPLLAGVWRFGPNSLERHRAAAAEHGLRFRVLDLSSLRIDADRAEDLSRIAAEPAPTATFHMLRELGLVEGRAAG